MAGVILTHSDRLCVDPEQVERIQPYPLNGPRFNPAIDSLPVLIVNPYSRCNCRCVMCDIWKETETRGISPDCLERQLASVDRLGVQWVVFSGGEPLMHPEISRLCFVARRHGARVSILSTGLLLGKHAAETIGYADDIIVSLDGPAEVHDKIRRVPSAFASLASGVQRIHHLNPGFQVSARCTVQSWNCGSLVDTVRAAREMGLRSVSFLAADLHSDAFNRPAGLEAPRRSELAVGENRIAILDAQIEEMIASGYAGGFVLETPAKLRKIVAHFRSYLGLEEHVAPACNAPWVSSVIEADGSVRPCFFHRSIGSIGQGVTLNDILDGDAAREFRARLNVSTDPVCRRCVCSLHWQQATPATE